MIRFVIASLLALALVGCASDPAQRNRDQLGASQTVLAAAQTVVLNYRARPACTATPAALCRDAKVYEEMQRVDRVATGANNAAYEALKRDPAASSTKFLISAAVNAIDGYAALTKEAK